MLTFGTCTCTGFVGLPCWKPNCSLSVDERARTSPCPNAMRPRAGACQRSSAWAATCSNRRARHSAVACSHGTTLNHESWAGKRRGGGAKRSLSTSYTYLSTGFVAIEVILLSRKSKSGRMSFWAALPFPTRCRIEERGRFFGQTLSLMLGYSIVR